MFSFFDFAWTGAATDRQGISWFYWVGLGKSYLFNQSGDAMEHVRTVTQKTYPD